MESDFSVPFQGINLDIPLDLVSFNFHHVSSHLGKINVLAPDDIVKKVFDLTVNLYKKEIQVLGFSVAPDSYVKEHYRDEIDSAVKNFLLHYFVLDFIIERVIELKIPVASYPRLIAVEDIFQVGVNFTFDISLADNLEIKEWKYFPFKSPRRKNYKDLDKQVDIFLKKSIEGIKKIKYDVVEDGDWVYFEVILTDNDNKIILPFYKRCFWLKINPQSFTVIVSKYFSNKKNGDSFCIDLLPLSKDFEDNIFERHNFFVTIKDIVKGNVFLVNDFRSVFKLKNKVELHEKLIEVFSFRNDVSQRRSIIEEMFHLFFSKHRFEVPKHLVIRKKEDLLLFIKKRPDYLVYKQNLDFEDQVERLSERILKEEILMDQIAGNEDIIVDSKDIKCYLNLLCNSRLKEFVYFRPLNEAFDESIVPIHDTLLQQTCRREKTLNHILYTLTK